MADHTIFGLPETLGASLNDYIALHRTALNGARKIRLDRFFQRLLPASGSYLTIATVQDVLALKNFDAGITLGGQTDVLNHYSRGSWAATAEIADAPTGGVTAGSTIEDARYTRIGPLLKLTFRFTAITTGGMTPGNLIYIRGFPFPVFNSANYRDYGDVSLVSITYSGDPQLNVSPGNSFCNISCMASGVNLTTLTVAAINSGVSTIAGSIWCETD